MAVSSKISKKPWGDVDKTALGNAVASAYASGKLSRGDVRQIYLYVPDDAFTTEDGKKSFAHSKAKLPVAEYGGGNITINRNGVHAAYGAIQGARTPANIPAADKARIRSKLRGLYRKIGDPVPDDLKDSLAVIIVSKPVEELVKGSWDYAMDQIRRAFNAKFNTDRYDHRWYICETFTDHVIVTDWSSEAHLQPDEYFKVGYRYNADAEYGYDFDDRDDWEIVELAYQAQTTTDASADAYDATDAEPDIDALVPDAVTAQEPVPVVADASAIGAAAPLTTGTTATIVTTTTAVPAAAVIATDTVPVPASDEPKRFVETMLGEVTLVDSQANGDGPWKIRGVGSTADVVNGNNRRYPASILSAAVEALRTHLHESAGQGRYIDRPVTGESDHPGDKGNRRPLLSETVVNWKSVSFENGQVLLEGLLLGTARGRDIHALMQGEVKPGISQRGYGESRIIEEDGHEIEEVTKLTITGYDFTNPGEQADPDSRVTYNESRQPQGEDDMTFEEFLAKLKEQPEAFDAVLTERLTKASADGWSKLEGQVREALGIGSDADLADAMKIAAQARRDMIDKQRVDAIEAAIIEHTKDLPYGQLNDTLITAVRSAQPATVEAVKPVVDTQRKVFDDISSKLRLKNMGLVTTPKGSGVKVLGPVLEVEYNLPAYCRAAIEFTDSLVRTGKLRARDLTKPRTINEEFAARVLAQFDALFQPQLILESRRLEEAETTADLSLPYSVSRVITAEAIPQLIATSVFDTGVIDTTPTRLYFEKYAAESGATAAVVDELTSAPAVLNNWVALANKQLQPGTVVLQNNAATVTYVEGTDFVVDYLGGRWMPLTGGAITAAQANLKIDYTYDAIRKGEMASVERGKQTFTFKTLEVNPARLAMQLSSEVVTYSRSQLGWDATARTVVSLIDQITRKIDKGLFYLALAASLQQANNSGGTWASATDAIQLLVDKLGVSRVKVGNRFYQPTAILTSLTNSDRLSNWAGFTQSGARPDADLNAEGYVGRLKALPVFQSVNFTDGYVLVFNREVVQYRIFQPMTLKGPYPSYSTDGELIAADQWMVEQYDGAESTVVEKASHVVIT